jgi:hypothetical protein
MEDKSLDFFKGRLLRFLQSTGRITLPKFSERKLFSTDLVHLLVPEVKTSSAAILPSLLQRSDFNRSLCEDFCDAHGLDRMPFNLSFFQRGRTTFIHFALVGHVHFTLGLTTIVRIAWKPQNPTTTGGFALMVYIAAVLLVPIPAISREQLIQTGPKRKHFVDSLDFWTELPPLIRRCDPDRIASWLSEKCWRRLIPYDYERMFSLSALIFLYDHSL